MRDVKEFAMATDVAVRTEALTQLENNTNMLMRDLMDRKKGPQSLDIHKLVKNAVAEGLATALPSAGDGQPTMSTTATPKTEPIRVCIPCEQTRKALDTLHANAGELMRFMDDLLSSYYNTHPHAVRKLPSGDIEIHTTTSKNSPRWLSHRRLSTKHNTEW